MTDVTSADFLGRVGKRTPLFARFSTTAGEKGSAESVRDVRGMAFKMYTNEGNLDCKHHFHFLTFQSQPLSC